MVKLGAQQIDDSSCEDGAQEEQKCHTEEASGGSASRALGLWDSRIWEN